MTSCSQSSASIVVVLSVGAGFKSAAGSFPRAFDLLLLFEPDDFKDRSFPIQEELGRLGNDAVPDLSRSEGIVSTDSSEAGMERVISIDGSFVASANPSIRAVIDKSSIVECENELEGE